MPKAQRKKIDQENALYHFMEQKNISAKNIAFIEEVITEGVLELQELARVVLQVALLAPRRRKRHRRLAKDHRYLLFTLGAMHLIDFDRFYDYGPEDELAELGMMLEAMYDGEGAWEGDYEESGAPRGALLDDDEIPF